MMLAESAPRDASWAVVSRTVFWSRDVSLTVWRAGVISGHRSYLPDSVKGMSTWNFIRFLGRRTFVDSWPEIREFLETDLPGDVARLDAVWSYAATGTFNMPPQAARTQLPTRSREVLDAVVRNQGASICDVAKLTNAPYQRTHAHVGSLIELGLVRKRLEGSGPRKVARLYTMR